RTTHRVQQIFTAHLRKRE
ncbi:hypothetical protein D047_2119B, partial [Vibrio parahaemolyticus VPTS-2010_2]